jgi:integrase
MEIFRKKEVPMKIEQLPSGSYRIRKMYKGVPYSVVVDHKPTQKEAIQLMAEAMEKDKTDGVAGNSGKNNNKMDFQAAAEKFLETNSNVFSPSTIPNYRSILRNLSDDFKALCVKDITGVDVQEEINKYSVGRAPKTVRNAHGFILSVLGMFQPDLNISTNLPKKRKTKYYIPSDEEVKKILHRAKGSDYEIALILATFGLRRSEICAVTPDDINGNLLTIDKSKVVNDEKKFVTKDTTKTPESTRTIYLPDSVVDLIKERGVIYRGHPGNILKYLTKLQKELGIPHFRLHDMRHYYASMSHSLGIPDSYIMQSGGWKSDITLKTVYRHAMEDKKDEMQEFAAQYISELIE